MNAPNDTAFAAWIADLKKVIVDDGGPADYVEQTGGVESWIEAFDDDMTPAEAWDEEKYAAHALGCL